MGAPLGGFLQGFNGVMGPALEKRHKDEQDAKKSKIDFYQKIALDPNYSETDRTEAQAQLTKLWGPDTKKAWGKIAPIVNKVMGAHAQANGGQQPQQGQQPDQAAPQGNRSPMSEQPPPGVGQKPGGPAAPPQGAPRTFGAGYGQDQAAAQAVGAQKQAVDTQKAERQEKIEAINASGLKPDEKHEAILKVYGITPPSQKESKKSELQDKLDVIDADTKLSPTDKAKARLAAYGLHDEKPPTEAAQKDQETFDAFKQNHKIVGRDLTAAEKVQARGEAKVAEEDPNIKALREATLEATRQRISDARQKASERAPEVIKSYAQDYAAGKIKITDIPAEARGAALNYMRNTGQEPPVTLAPDAQKLLAMTAPILDQIQAAKKELEDRGLKDNNHDFYFAKDRIKYAAGLDSGTTGLIANLSMAGILGASRILKGGASRTKQIFQEAQQHTPNVWKDSPKLVYDKLSQMETSIQNGNAALYEEQRSGTAPPVKPGMLPPKSSASGPTQAPKIKILSVTAVSP